MAEVDVAKLVQHGRSNVLRLPKAIRLPITGVRRIGRGVVLESLKREANDIQTVFDEIDRLTGCDFLPREAGATGLIGESCSPPAGGEQSSLHDYRQRKSAGEASAM